MPQVQVVDLNPVQGPPTQLDRTLAAFKETRERDTLKSIYDTYINNGEDLNVAFRDLQTKEGLSPTARVNATNNLIQLKKANNEHQEKLAKRLEEQDKKENQQKEVYNIYTSGGLPEEEARERSLTDSAATARSHVKSLGKPNTPAISKEEQSYRNKNATLAATEAAKLRETIAKNRDVVTNLNEIEKQVAENLQGVKGWVKGKIGTESAKIVENLSAASLDGIIKLFNPAGTLPTAKLNWIRETFAIKATDLDTEIKGKVKAMRILATQAIERAELRLKIIEKYHGNPPPEFQNFDQETENLLDTTTDELAFEEKLKESQKSGVMKDMYVADRNSKRFGQKIASLPIAEAKKLYEEGKITNVPQY